MRGKRGHTHVRVMDQAAALFIARGLNDVSIAEIAARSHCSTATIYEMFETKNRLFLEALEHAQKNAVPPSLVLPPLDEQALGAIVAYGLDRIAYLTSDRTRGLMLASAARSEAASESLRHLFRERDQVSVLEQAVTMAMAAKHLRPHGGSTNVAYCMMAGLSAEPVIMSLHRFGAVDPIALVRRIFAMFVTEGGEEMLEAYLGQRAGSEPCNEVWTYLRALYRRDDTSPVHVSEGSASSH